jgi:alkylated DNA repair dioxygenase AlkB
MLIGKLCLLFIIYLHFSSERSIQKPLVSVSLGQDAIYLTGGKSLDDPVDAILLQSGDVLVMHGDQRLVYHAVPRILTTRKFVDETKTINPKVLAYANRSRVNITLRQVD